MNWLNPKTWFKKKGPGVYFAVTLDAPALAGISLTQPRKPWVFVEDIGLEDAARRFPRINWHTVPMAFRSRLELGDQCLSCSLEEAKGVFEGL